MTRFLLPFAVFIAIGLALMAGLRRDPRELPSALVGKPAPAFELPVLEADGRTVRASDLRGKVWMLNVWASWCGPCQLEHPLIMDLARQTRVPVVGLNYKDKPEAARAWLQRLGNPYSATLVDPDGRTGIDFGVYGVPETFVIDGEGIVRFRQAGPLTAEALEKRVLPLMRQLEMERVDARH
jgi:cytochrome c biogenesis protein CcmG/thiol:disulfide interchange protein DsbE